MTIGPRPSFACLIFASALVGASRVAAGIPGDPLAAEAEVRKADADWTAAASTRSVDAWMSFYAADAIVLLPQDQLASGREPVRQAVIRLLSPPHLSMASRPIDVQVSQSADVASLIEIYELRADSQGRPTSSRGRRLEIWRKQADGSWRCIVDTWNLDQSPAVPSAVPPAGPQTAPPTVAPVPPLAQPVPPPAEPVPASPSKAPDSGAPLPEAATQYGDRPVNYDRTIRQYFQDHLGNPGAVQFRDITPPQQGYATKLVGGLLMREKRVYGWTVKVTVNTKDSSEKYVGFKTYTFLFRGEKILDARLDLPGEPVR